MIESKIRNALICVVLFLLLFFSAVLFSVDKAYAASGETDADVAVAWDFEKVTDGKISDASDNGRTGTVLKADLSSPGNLAPSKGWMAARWDEQKDASASIVYDIGRNSNVFYTAGDYEILYDDSEFYNDFTDFTFSCWVKFGTVPPANVNVFTRSAWLFAADRRAQLDSFTGIGFDYGFAGQQTFYNPPGKVKTVVHTSDYILTKSTWFNLTAVIDDGDYKLYMDGVQIPLIGAGQTSDDSKLKADCGVVPSEYSKDFDTLTLGGCHQTGAQFGGFFRPADMFLDNACFYAKALSEAEIKSVMNGNILLKSGGEEPLEDEGCNSSMQGGIFGFAAISMAAAVIVFLSKKNRLGEGK